MALLFLLIHTFSPMSFAYTLEDEDKSAAIALIFQAKELNATQLNLGSCEHYSSADQNECIKKLGEARAVACKSLSVHQSEGSASSRRWNLCIVSGDTGKKGQGASDAAGFSISGVRAQGG